MRDDRKTNAFSFSRYARGSYEHDDNAADSASPRCVDPEDEECQTPRTPLDLPLRMSSYIDAEYSDLEGSPVVSVRSR